MNDLKIRQQWRDAQQSRIVSTGESMTRAVQASLAQGNGQGTDLNRKERFVSTGGDSAHAEVLVAPESGQMGRIRVIGYAQKGGESFGFKTNAEGDLIICIGSSACSSPSNIANATNGQIASGLADLVPQTKLAKGAKWTAEQIQNIKRFRKKVPSNAKDSLTLHELPNGGVAV